MWDVSPVAFMRPLTTTETENNMKCKSVEEERLEQSGVSGPIRTKADSTQLKPKDKEELKQHRTKD